MAAAYASHNVSSITAGNPVVTKPTGLAVGDVLIGFSATIAIGDVVTFPSGFTSLGGVSSSGGLYLEYGYKVADAADVAASNFTFTNGGAAAAVAGLVRVTGGSTNFDHNAVAGTPGGNSLAAGVTPTIADTLMLMVIAGSDQSNVARTVSGYAIATDNPSWTEIIDTSATTDDDLTLAVAYATRPQTSATGNVSFTPSGAMATTAAALIAVNPQINVSTSPAVLSAAFGVQGTTVTGTANVTPAAINLAAVIQTPTVATPTPQWTNPDKSSSPSWTNSDKS